MSDEQMSEFPALIWIHSNLVWNYVGGTDYEHDYKISRVDILTLFFKTSSLGKTYSRTWTTGSFAKKKTQLAWNDKRGRWDCACAVGWSDLELFVIFETYTLLSIRYIFRSSIPKVGKFRSTAKFSFSKNHRDLKFNIFCWKFAEFFFKYLFFKFPKWAKRFLI